MADTDADDPAPDDASRMEEVLARLRAEYPDAGIVLDYETDVQLLVAVILSAQCTDEVVNRTTPPLFERCRTADDFAAMDRDELEEVIRPCGFFRNKAEWIQGSCRILAEEHGGEVPDSMEAMLELPGVARKTANVVLGNAHGVVEGIAVDTHVWRLADRLGFTDEENSRDKVEEDLMAVTPKEDWFDLTYLLIDHGRAVCDARKPRCSECVLFDLCPSGEELLEEGQAV